ncbi:MAG: hypothetical protein H6742_14875 [Alphaproteobacteria bacterium]|nr:hypothetical protein [Alphaproteobacteria bacterium]
MDLNEKMQNVRRASRLLAAYYRRVMTILAMVERTLDEKKKLRLKLHYWSSTQHQNIGKQSTNPVGRWGWDFLVLQDTWFRWSTDGKAAPVKPGSVQVYFQHVTDDAYDKPEDGTEPDPATFASVEESQSWVYLYAYALVRGSCEDSWASIDGVFEDTANEEDEWSGEVVVVQSDGLENPSADVLVHYVGWRVPMTDLETEDDVEAKLLQPLRAALDKIVIAPTA